MKPHHMWSWFPGNLRISLILGLFSALGAVFYVLGRREGASDFKKAQSVLLLCLWCLVLLSHQFSSYSGYPLPAKMIPPSAIISVFNTIMVFYFVTILCVSDARKLYLLGMSLAFIGVCFVYWSNERFLYYGYSIFTHAGRMEGPSGQDENVFALRVILTVPFLFYMGSIQDRKWLKYILWASCLLAWHSVFLTGSRGGLLGLVVTVLLIAWGYNSKRMSLLLSGLLVVGALTQSGTIIDRIQSTVDKSEESTEEAADPRLISWATGFSMLFDRPLLGVGAGRFQQASSDYGADIPYVAHNTFLQFAANSGLIVGLIYLWLFYACCKSLPSVRKLPLSEDREVLIAHTMYMASATSLLGFFVCAIFLDLMLYESFYLILAINFLSRKFLSEKLNTGI
jgi:O-antigen ligase